jgi:hypothetical protein
MGLRRRKPLCPPQTLMRHPQLSEPGLHCARLAEPIDFAAMSHVDCAAISREACHDDEST